MSSLLSNIKYLLVVAFLGGSWTVKNLVTSDIRDDDFIYESNVSFTKVQNTRILASARPSIEEQNKYAPKLVLLNDLNRQKINGHWRLQEVKKIGDKTSAADVHRADKLVRVYVELTAQSTITITHLGDHKAQKTEHKIGLLSDNSMIAFQYLENGVLETYTMKKVPGGVANTAMVPPPIVPSKDIRTAPVGSEKIVIGDGEHLLEMREAFDKKIKKIVKDNVEGSLRLVNGEVAEVMAYVNGTDLGLTVDTQKKGEFEYTADVEGGNNKGMAIATNLSNNQFGVYFKTGPYQGYNLVFGKALTAEEAYAKEQYEYEMEQREFDRKLTQNDNNNEYQEDENEGSEQNNAVSLRDNIAQMNLQRMSTPQAQAQVSQEDLEYQEYARELIAVAASGEELSLEEKEFLEDYSADLQQRGSYNFRSQN